MKIFKKTISFMVIGCLQAGLILLGWGFNDITGFFKYPARAIFIASIMLMMLSSALFMEKANVKFVRKGKKGNSCELITGALLPTLFTIVILFISPYSDSHNFMILGGGDILSYIGLFIFIIGAIFSCWGPAHLGKQFSMGVTIQEEHKLVTDGPFRYIRHPRYLGISLWVIGAAMIFCSIIGLVLAIIILMLFVWRIYLEEEMLCKEFGKEWKEYCKKTKNKLVPFIY